MKASSNKIDLLVSFDTTGSMYPVLSQVRQQVEEFVHSMFSEFNDLRLGIIAHGDYCDKDNPYTIRCMDFTRDENKLCKFVKETAKTFGGDADECYELVLNTAHSKLEWRDDANKIMIMIGDASPHEVNYRDNKDRLDWVEEADKLRVLGVKVFAVHALSYYRSSSKAFYKRVADDTLGVYLTLDQFNEIDSLIKATCYQQGGEEKLSEFISIIRDNGKMTRSMENNFKRLRGEEVEDTYESVYTPKKKRTSSIRKSDEHVSIKEMAELVPVMPGRFQVMTVDSNCDIKGFVNSNGIEFKKGRGFYELSKAETVQQYKEIIMQDKETGEMFNGSQVREKLGLQPQSEKGGVNEKLYAKDAKEFRIFIQSTSVNRKLIAGTTFLYEISDIEDTGTEIVVDSTSKKKVKTETTEKKDPVVKKETPKSKKKTVATVEKAIAEVKETPVEKKTKAVDKKETPKSKKKVAEKETVDSFFTSVKASGIEEPTVDESMKVVKVKKQSADEVAAAKEKARLERRKVDRAKKLEQLKEATNNVTDGVVRTAVSENKKNTAYLVNNLKKTIKYATDMLNSLE